MVRNISRSSEKLIESRTTRLEPCIYCFSLLKEFKKQNIGMLLKIYYPENDEEVRIIEQVREYYIATEKIRLEAVKVIATYMQETIDLKEQMGKSLIDQPYNELMVTLVDLPAKIESI